MHDDPDPNAPLRDGAVTPMRWPCSERERGRSSGLVAGWAEIATGGAPVEVADAATVPEPPLDESRLRFDEADLARACAATAGEAHRRALSQASSSSAARQVELLRRIGGEIIALHEALAADASRARHELVVTARAIAQALTFRREGDRLAELEAIITELVRQAPHGADLTLEVGAAEVEALRPRLTDIGLTVVASSDLGPLDARLHWQGGWLEHLRAGLEAAIDAVLLAADPEPSAHANTSSEEQP